MQSRIPHARPAMTGTRALILINVAVHVCGLVLSRPLPIALVARDVWAGNRLETLLLNQFLHGGLLHLGTNLVFLIVFGGQVEKQFGRLEFFLIVTACGLIGSIAQVLVLNPAYWDLPMYGASGAISGVLGAYVVFYPRERIKIEILLRETDIPIALGVLAWFVVSLLASLGAQTEVGHSAHVVGFCCGATVALIAKTRRVNTSGCQA